MQAEGTYQGVRPCPCLLHRLVAQEQSIRLISEVSVGANPPKSTMLDELKALQRDLVMLMNPHMFADLSGRVTDLSGVSKAESWQLQVAIDNVKQEMQFIIDIRNGWIEH